MFSLVVIIIAILGITNVQASERDETDGSVSDGLNTERCAVQLAQASNSYATTLCYFQAAQPTGQWQAAARELDALATKHPESIWFVLVRGYALARLGGAEAVPVYMQAANQFAEQNEILGELLARANLRLQLFAQGRLEEARQQVSYIRKLGLRSDDIDVRVRALLVEGLHLLATREDLQRAQDALLTAEDELQQTNNYFLRREVLNGLGGLSLVFGHFADSVNYFAQFAVLAKDYDDLAGYALAVTNGANALYEWGLAEPTAVDWQTVLAQAERGLAAAQKANSQLQSLFAQRLSA